MTVTEEELAAVLRHCRALAAAADELSTLLQRRVAAAEGALARWRGPSARAFAARTAADDDAARAGIRLLRVEADAWARAWADAVNEHRARQAAEPATVDGGIMHGRPLGRYEPVPVPRAESGYAPTGGLSLP